MSDPMAPSQKAWIDGANYYDMLRLWRFAPAGDPMFSGETGKYYTEIMAKRRATLGPEVHTAASKSTGWER